MQQFLMSPAMALGLILVCATWFIYFSGYRYGRHLLLIVGVVSLLVISWLLGIHFLHIDMSVQRLVAPSNAPFFLNLAYLFVTGYIIQILYYWLPRTKLLVNICLAVILSIALLSMFGHVYTLDGINQEALLLPMPFAAILSYFFLILAIFIHTNRMERFYLNGQIVLSFVTLFLAIAGANVVVYFNLNHAVGAGNSIYETQQLLLDTYNVNFYLNGAQTAVQAYQETGDLQYITAYKNSAQLYRQTIVALEQSVADNPSVSGMQRTASSISELGNKTLNLMNSVITQKQSKQLAPHTLLDEQVDTNMQQLFDQSKTLSSLYASQLDNFTYREYSGGRGIVLGVSITSTLSLLLIIFTPLFIRQTIQRLSLAEGKLRISNRSLAEEKTRAEAVLASIGDGLFAVDIHGVISVFNKAAEELTGLQRKLVLGKQYSEVLRFKTAVDFTARALQNSESHLTHNAVLERAHGQAVDVQISASPVHAKDGPVIGAIVVFRDRSSEQALETAKDDFVSLASHQLRTPATATKQFLAMFLQGYAGHIDDKQRFFLQQAYDNNEIGIKIVEDLLNITRFESDKLKLVKERIELGTFLDQSVSQHKALAEQGKQEIQIISPKKRIFIETDINLLSMAVDNLITNALKYSNQGNTITIKLSDGGHPAIAVHDEGIGMREEDIPKIFGRFTRLEDPRKEYVSGTGIGLYLVKKIVKKMHATIKVESEYGKGSTFTLIFKEVE